MYGNGEKYNENYSLMQQNYYIKCIIITVMKLNTKGTKTINITNYKYNKL